MSIEPRARPSDTFAVSAPDVASSNTGADAEEWSQLWFTLERHGWGSLALIPAAPGASARALAERLAHAARAYQTTAVEVFDAEHAAPEDVQAVVAAVGGRAAVGERVLLVVASPLIRASAIPLARAADAAALVVPLGEVGAADARRTVGAVGHPHFVGSVTVRGR
ncbi:hypothetical protein tb265_43910 [Gemmatimonadetes bacterium T265]|nr:hypothetical protein tb265_43910 [Gemmatimonadetes bacterium T265]